MFASWSTTVVSEGLLSLRRGISSSAKSSPIVMAYLSETRNVTVAFSVSDTLEETTLGEDIMTKRYSHLYEKDGFRVDATITERADTSSARYSWEFAMLFEGREIFSVTSGADDRYASFGEAVASVDAASRAALRDRT